MKPSRTSAPMHVQRGQSIMNCYCIQHCNVNKVKSVSERRKNVNFFREVCCSKKQCLTYTTEKGSVTLDLYKPQQELVSHLIHTAARSVSLDRCTTARRSVSLHTDVLQQEVVSHFTQTYTKRSIVSLHTDIYYIKK